MALALSLNEIAAAEAAIKDMLAMLDAKIAARRGLSFLADTFGRDADMAAFVQRLSGYSASGDIRYQILPGKLVKIERGENAG
mgnify:CR=1 FL=1